MYVLRVSNFSTWFCTKCSTNKFYLLEHALLQIFTKHSTKFSRSEHVAKALINILANGKSGSVWLVENGQPAREVTYSKHWATRGHATTTYIPSVTPQSSERREPQTKDNIYEIYIRRTTDCVHHTTHNFLATRNYTMPYHDESFLKRYNTYYIIYG